MTTFVLKLGLKYFAFNHPGCSKR